MRNLLHFLLFVGKQISNKQAQDIANTQRQFKVNHLKKMKGIKEYANEQRSVKNRMIKSFSNITQFYRRKRNEKQILQRSNTH